MGSISGVRSGRGSGSTARGLAAALLLLFLCACQSGSSVASDPEASSTADPAVEPNVSGSPVATSTPLDKDLVKLAKTTVRTRKGEKWKLDADKVDWHDSRRQAEAYEVEWFLLDEKEQPTVRVVAPRADLDMEAERVEFHGQVVATRLTTNDVLRVNHLVWEGVEKKFYGSEGVRWIRGISTVVGDTMVATSHLEKVRLHGNVRAYTVLDKKS